MSVFVIAVDACAACQRTFGFNPKRVPSIPIDGIRRPICLECMERANATRSQNNLKPHLILPNAYGPAEHSIPIVADPAVDLDCGTRNDL